MFLRVSGKYKPHFHFFSISSDIRECQATDESSLRCGFHLTESGSSGQSAGGGSRAQPATGVQTDFALALFYDIIFCCSKKRETLLHNIEWNHFL